MGLDMQLVMPPPPQCYFTVPVEIAVKATRVLNDGIAAYVARKPDRFVALGTVPLQDGNEAANELERSMKELGFKGCRSSPMWPARNCPIRPSRRSGPRRKSSARWS